MSRYLVQIKIGGSVAEVIVLHHHLVGAGGQVQLQKDNIDQEFLTERN